MLCVLPTSAGGAGELPPTHSAPLPAGAEPDPLPVGAAAGVSGQRAAQPGHPLLPLRRGGGVCVSLSWPSARKSFAHAVAQVLHI